VKRGAQGSAAECTITVRVPLAVQRRRRGRKAIVSPEASSGLPLPIGWVESPLLIALARAFYWRRLFETGVHVTVEELAAAQKVDPSYASRVLRLTHLAPDIIQATLRGSTAMPPLAQVLRPFPLEWNAQRASFDI
jgi:hypothetical protein